MSKSTTKRSNRNNNLVLETKPPEPEKEDELPEELNFEIECARCGDVMELCSEFDRLSYYCGSCQLKMNVN
jgi:formamidopyrimidine-DNA glycosylase